MKKKGVFISAISTGTGKTIVSSVLCNKLLNNNIKTIYYKPIQTGCLNIKGKLESPDCNFIKKTTGNKIKTFCSYSFIKPASPHFASRLENNEIKIDKIKKDYSALIKENYFVVVEGAGGLYVPINEKGKTMLDLAKTLKLEIILIANAGLGAINQVMLSFFYAKKTGTKISNIIFLYNAKKPDDIENDNYRIIKKLTGIKNVYLFPAVKHVNTDKCKTGDLIKKEKFWDIDLGEITG